MTLTKEQMREYQKKRRQEARKSLGVEEKSKSIEIVSPIILKMIEDLQKRVDVVESLVREIQAKPAILPHAAAVRQQLRAVSSQGVGRGVDPDLFRRVIAEKELRLKG